jgi:phosphoglycolate phosphatase
MTSQPLIKAVLFDLDGTLIDSAPDLHVAANNLLSEESRSAITLEQTTSMIGDGVPKIVERAFAATGYTMEEDELDGLVNRYLEFYEPHSADLTSPFPGGVECLKRLRHRGYELAVCTNKPFIATQKILRSLDLADSLSAVIGGDTLPGIKKPNPRHLLAALDIMKISPKNAIMIGDHANDVNAARAAGMPVIICRFGYTNGPAENLEGDLVIDHFDELPDAFFRLSYA